MRIGLFGGTFNPVHNGHIALASRAKAKLKLDKVIFIPAYFPVHKDAVEIADSKDRLVMIEFAIEKQSGFEVSPYEIDKKEKVYSVETIRYFKDSYPQGTDIFFLAGADALPGLDTWKDLDKIFTLCEFVIFTRPGFLMENALKQVITVDMDEVDASSTQIRERVIKDDPISELVPFQVADYIAKKNLYKHPR